MHKIDWLPLIVRTCVMALFLATLCLLGDFVVVLVIRLTYHAVVFTLFWAICMFGFLSGLVPFSASPLGIASRVSFGGRKTRVGMSERIIIFALMALFVVLAAALSELYQRSIHEQPYPLTYVAVMVFVFVAVIFLIRNWRYIKWDAQNASAEH